MENCQRSKADFVNKYTTIILPVLLLILDYGAILCAEEAAFALRSFILPQGGTLRISWFNWHIVFPGCMLLIIQIKGLYQRRMQFWVMLSNLFRAVLYGMIGVVLTLYVAQTAASTSRLFVVLFAIFTFIFITLERFASKKIFHAFHVFQVPVLLMGAGLTASLILPYLEKDSGMGYNFIGYLEDGVPKENVAKMMPCLGTFADAERVIKETGVKRVMVIAPGLHQKVVQNIIYRLQPLVTSVGFVPDLGDMPLGNLKMTTLVDGHAVMFKVHNNLAHWYNRWLKFIFDWVVTLVGTIIIAPLLIGIALWIYKDSPGPVIFKHMRVGKDGKEFPCYKFRSMCVDAKDKLEELLHTDPAAKEEWERDFKLKDDPRITRSGDFLRKTSLDELPQIFNVLKGEMSLVGPRPIIQAEVERYGDYIDDYYMVRPGITGMWQTSGRSDVDYHERVQLDTWYVRNWSVWFDIVLLYRTFSVVLNKKGAY